MNTASNTVTDNANNASLVKWPRARRVNGATFTRREVTA